jgi:hypothetical protein
MAMSSIRRAGVPAYLSSDVGEAILDAAEAIAEKGVHAFKAPRRGRRGATTRPGADTPLWNTLVTEIRPHLKQRGAQANLARLLGVPRQQVNAYFTLRTRMPDAERTLKLLAWLVAAREAKQQA